MAQLEKAGSTLPHAGPTPAVRFPLPDRDQEQSKRPWSRLAALLPGTWRRQVVIQGHRYWLPG